MPLYIKVTPSASADLEKFLRKNPKKKDKVKKALARLSEEGPKHPGLGTHKMRGVPGEAVFISYIENHTPGAWRIHWSWWGDNTIIVIYVGPHP